MFTIKKHFYFTISFFISSFAIAQNHFYINQSGQENTYTSFQNAVDATSAGDFIHLSNTDIVTGNVSITSKNLTILPETIGEEIEYGGTMSINNSIVTLIGFGSGDINIENGNSGDTINIISSTIEGFSTTGSHVINIYDSKIEGTVTMSSGSIIASELTGSLILSSNSSTSETIKVYANKLRYIELNNSYKIYEIRNNYIYTIGYYGIKILNILNSPYDFIIANNLIKGYNTSSSSSQYYSFAPIYFSSSFSALNSVQIMNNYFYRNSSFPYYGVYFSQGQDNLLISNNIMTYPNICNQTHYADNNVTSSSFTYNSTDGTVGSPTLSSDNGLDGASFLDIDNSINDIGIEGGPYSIRNFYFDNDALGKARIIDLDLPSEMFYGEGTTPIIIKSKGVHINE